MTDKKKDLISVSVVIPTFECQDTAVREISNVLTLLKQTNMEFEIVIVDDNSQDMTYKNLKQKFSKIPSIRLIKNKTNKGIAENIQFAYSLGKNDYILLYSIDGDWRYTDIKKIITHGIKTNSDLVIGKRKIKKGYSFERHIISFFYNFLPLLIFQVNTIDAGSIKMFHKSLLNHKFLSKSIFYESELIIRAKNDKKRVSYVTVGYEKKKRTKKNINRQHVYNSFLDMLRLRISL